MPNSLSNSFNDHQIIEKNMKWLEEQFSDSFKTKVSKPWQAIIANQLTLLKAHNGLDHLMSKNEACLITTKQEFEDETICQIYDHHLIESFHRFTSKTSFEDQGPLVIIFLTFMTSVPSKELYEPEQITSFNSEFKKLNLSFSTLSPHSVHSKLFKLIKVLNSKIDHLSSQLTEYQDGYWIQLNLELSSSLDEALFEKAKFYLFTNFSFPQIEQAFDPSLSYVIDALATLSHQILNQLQVDRFSPQNIEATCIRYKELIKEITLKCLNNLAPQSTSKPLELNQEETKIRNLDTGNQNEDEKRKIILLLYLNLLKSILKTNVYIKNKNALSFRLNASFFKDLPELKQKFPEEPFGIFFMKGEGFFGFHIRFKDLSRGGLRTVLSRTKEQSNQDRLNVFSECYNLSFTQQKKNKDIPEGGAKGIIFVELHKLYEEQVNKALWIDDQFFQKYRTFTQRLSQKRYILSLLDLVNADDKGHLRDPQVTDLLKKQEILFLGPDENMSDPMIEWIAATSLKKAYSTKTAFISSKPAAGINHKTYGVTSYGVNAYMEEALKFLNIDPLKQPFTVKISGGPDGDVAGNQMLNLKKYYPKTAKLVAITDVSGTIYDPQGLDLNLIETLFHEAKPIRFYPHEALHQGSYLLDLQTKKQDGDLNELTLLVTNKTGQVESRYLKGAEMNQLFRQSLHQVKADIFIPGGGRPRTLNEFNVHEFLDEKGSPTSKAIIEGANLYLTPQARHFLETKGVLIFKDSSSNKGGVICSSYEVIGGLCLDDDSFIAIKEHLAQDILKLIKDKAQKEARLLLDSFKANLGFMSDLSDEVSLKINTYKYELLEALTHHELSVKPSDPLNKIVLEYVPEVIRKQSTPEHILSSISDIHKKAIIACHLGSNIVYLKGLSWNPGIAELLPLLLKNIELA